MKPQGSVQSTLQKSISGNSDQNLRKGRLQRLLFLSNSAWFSNIGQSILLVIRKLQWPYKTIHEEQTSQIKPMRGIQIFHKHQGHILAF